MMRDLGVMLQQQGVEVKAKGLGDGVDSLSLKIKLDATAGRAIAMRRVLQKDCTPIGAIDGN